jgi:shikimate dehydrogenase
MIRGTTRVVGVFGYPVKHSASPAMHNAAFAALGLDWVYVPFEVAPENIGAALAGVRALNLAGVNVTVPLKELVPPHLDRLIGRAELLGAVNTVIHREGQLLGDSTDGPGFLAALAQEGVTVGPGSQVVVLGAGGSSRAVVQELVSQGATVLLANRNQERAETLAKLVVGPGSVEVIALSEEAVGQALTNASVLVNTTSVGMHPNHDEMPPVPPDALSPSVFVSDLIYNPAETRLLARARSRGCRTQNGIEMLVRQGAISFTHWTGIEPPVEVMRNAVAGVLGIRL